MSPAAEAAHALRVAVVLASAGRPALLADVVSDLRAQTGVSFVGVVSVPDEASLPAGRNGLEGWEVLVGTRGLAAQRNAGLNHVEERADVVVFFDDDSVARPDYLRRATAFLAEHPHVVGMTGRVLLDGKLTREVPRALALARLAESGNVPPSGNWQRTRELYGANFAVRTATAPGLRFDPRLPLYSWLEDHDFARRLARHGELAHVDDCVIVHRAAESGGRKSHRRFGYSQVMNPCHLYREGSFPLWLAAQQLGRPVARNVQRSLLGDERSWRRERLSGNLLAAADVVRGRITPERITEIDVVPAPQDGATAIGPVRRVSVVIPNHNYDRYVAAAVSSALALDWPDVEVIVVDDGSTDESMAVLRGFGDRIRLIEQANSGPRVACNVGFAASTGDTVVFLDSDDVLSPSLIQEVASVWRPGVSKVQVQMRRVNADGQSAGGIYPAFDPVPTPQDLRQWMWQTSAYPTPPGSGNVYARPFLERLLPLDDSCGDATDSACLATAPLLGDVVTVRAPLVDYRVHRDNRSSLRTHPQRLTAQVDRAVRRHRFATTAAGATGTEALRALHRGRHLLHMRVAEARLVGGPPPLPGDSRGRMARDAVIGLGAPGPESMPTRVLFAVSALALLVVPRPVVWWLAQWRFR